MKIDKLNVAFFAIMVIGLLLFTIILLLRANTKVYESTFGDNISSTITLSGSNKIELSVTVEEVTQTKSSTYSEIANDDIDNNYLIANNEEDEKLEFRMKDDNIIELKYEDGTIVTYKEK